MMPRDPKNLYANNTITDPDGSFLCHCSNDRIEWYLKNNLADIVSNGPRRTIKLRFQPKGPGNRGEPFYEQLLINRCVVCGQKEKLSRHHIIPKCYRTCFPPEAKEHMYHDVVLLCLECHYKYEKEAYKLKRALEEEFNAPLSGTGWYNDREKLIVRKSANVLYRHGNKVKEGAPDVYQRMCETVREYLKKEPTEEDLQQLRKMAHHVKTEKFITHGAIIVSQLNQEGIIAFVKRWRRHFVDIMNPQFLHDHWGVDHRVFRLEDENEN